MRGKQDKTERLPIRGREDKWDYAVLRVLRVKTRVVGGNVGVNGCCSQAGNKTSHDLPSCVTSPALVWILKSSWCAAGLQRSPQCGETQWGGGGKKAGGRMAFFFFSLRAPPCGVLGAPWLSRQPPHSRSIWKQAFSTADGSSDFIPHRPSRPNITTQHFFQHGRWVMSPIL